MKVVKLIATFPIPILIIFLILTSQEGKTFGETADIDSPPSPPSPLIEIPFKDIFFDQGEFRLREDAKPVLKENAEIIISNPDIRVLIEGHCNKDEYAPNSNLGQKRADSVKSYLTTLGVDPHRVNLVPRCSVENDIEKFLGDLDLGWQLNNRVHLIGILNEGDRISLKTINN